MASSPKVRGEMSSSQDSDGSSGGGGGEKRGGMEKAVAERAKRKGSEWEILGTLEKGVTYAIKPKRHEGFLSKRRKWPLKGWHKR